MYLKVKKLVALATKGANTYWAPFIKVFLNNPKAQDFTFFMDLSVMCLITSVI